MFKEGAETTPVAKAFRSTFNFELLTGCKLYGFSIVERSR